MFFLNFYFQQISEENQIASFATSKYKREMDDFKTMLERKREERRLAISKIVHELHNLRQNREDLEKERTLRMGLERQVKALKEVSTVSNEMLQLRETQVFGFKFELNQLK